MMAESASLSLIKHRMKIKKNIALSDSGFLFNPTTGDSFSLNPIGHEIFLLLQAGTPDAEIVKTITEKYMIDAVTVEKDLYDFQNMLKTHKVGE